MLFKEVFGLDISDYSIEAVLLKSSRKKIKIAAYSRVKLAPGIVEDGKILNKDKLVEAIKELRLNAKPKPMATSYVVLSLPESRVLTHIFKIPPALDREQIRSALKYEAESVIPMDPDKIFWDFRTIYKDEEKQEVFYVACEKEIIDDFRAVLKRAGLSPVVFENESLALARSLIRPELIEKEDGVLIADIGARTTILSIFDKNGIRSSLNIPVAGNKFTEAIAEKLNVSLEKAEELKREYGLNLEKMASSSTPIAGIKNEKSEAGADNQDEGMMLMLILQSVLQPILQEMKNLMGYYERQTGRKIKKILLAGGSAEMPSIDVYLSDNLKMPAEKGKSWVESDAGIKGIKEISPILLINAVGLALRGLRKDMAEMDVNLLSIERPEMLKKMKGGKIARLLNWIYVKLSRRFQIFNFQEWALTLRKYRSYLLMLTVAVIIFALAYFFQPFLAKMDYVKIFKPVADVLQKIGRLVGPFFASAAKFFRNIFSSAGGQSGKLINSWSFSLNQSFLIFFKNCFYDIATGLNWLSQGLNALMMAEANFIAYIASDIIISWIRLFLR